MGGADFGGTLAVGAAERPGLLLEIRRLVRIAVAVAVGVGLVDAWLVGLAF